MYEHIMRVLNGGCKLSVERRDDGKILATISNDTAVAGMMSQGDTINTALSHLDRHVREALFAPRSLS